MGVRGITTFIRENLSSISTSRREYSLTDLNEDGVERDLVVVDGNAFVYWFSSVTFGRESCCLSSYSQLCESLEQWLGQCHCYSIRFIFVFDGPTEPSKWPSKIKRMKNQCNDIFNNQVQKLNHYDKDDSPLSSVIPVLGIQAVINVLKRFGEHKNDGFVEVFQADGEADRDIVTIAGQEEAVAILSNDSDMFFFNSCQLLSKPISADMNHMLVPVGDVPIVSFSCFHKSAFGDRFVMESLVERGNLAKAIGVRSEVGIF